MGSKYLCVERTLIGKTETYLQLTRGRVENSKTVAVFPRRSNPKEKSSNDDEDGHGQKHKGTYKCMMRENV